MSATTAGAVAPVPPDRRLPPAQWVRRNLASTPANAALTVVFGVVLGYGAFRLGRFVAVTADWEVVRRNLRLFMVGRFPDDELWRPWAAAYLLGATGGACAGLAGAAAPGTAVAATATRPRPARSAARAVAGVVLRWWPLALFAAAVAALVRTATPILAGAGLVAVVAVVHAAARRSRLPTRFAWPLAGLGVVGALVVVVGFGGVGWDDWGGLQLTVAVTAAGVVLAVPVGMAAALARRSELVLLRWAARAWIEVLRGVPLVSLLFLGQYVVLFLVPTSVDPPGFLVRAVIVIAAFESAYIAEIVRGGLQAVPAGQVEAAAALGLGRWSTLRRIVLPQALRAVIPAMVGQFISLYKDTSLLAIVGFFEVLQVARSVPNQSDFAGRGLSSVTLAFAGFVYWAGAFTLSRESRRLERRLGGGSR